MTYGFSNGEKLKQGFSLIELVIAIAILGLLAAIVGPRAVSYFTDAQKTKAKQEVKTFKQAITSYYMKSGEYPKSLDDLVRKPADLPAKKWGGPYVGGDDEENPEVPRDPWGNDYVYKLNPKGTKPPYQVYSWGPNGEGSPEEEWIF